jgi:hypothetical protein
MDETTIKPTRSVTDKAGEIRKKRSGKMPRPYITMQQVYMYSHDCGTTALFAKGR